MPRFFSASRAAEPPRIRLTDGAVEVRAPGVVGPANDAALRRFLERTLALPEVSSVRYDRGEGVAWVRPSPPTDAQTLLNRLASAFRSEPAVPPSLPQVWRSSCTIHRHGEFGSTCEIVVDQPGWLRLRHPRLKDDRLAADDCARRIADAPGVRHVKAEVRTGTLNVRASARTTTAELLAIVEESLDAPGWWDRESPPPPHASFVLPNANLAVGAAADLAMPGLGPVCAAMLVGGNLKTFRLALAQARERRAGLPVLYSVIIGGTLVSGNFLASALMSWSFKYWQDKLRVDLSAGRRRLLAECLPLPSRVWVDRGAGPVEEPLERLLPGDFVHLGPGDPVPADGRVTAGRGVVDQQAVCGLRGASRVDSGDELLAGGRVLHGALTLRIDRPSESARATAVGRALLAATTLAPGDAAVVHDAEAFAERTVGPTMLAAGVGLVAGGLDVATAVLRPDYATGLGVVGPLDSLRNVAAAARMGVVIRSPDSFTRLAGIDRLILDDSPELHRPGVRVASVRSEIPDDLVLRYAAAAFRHVADDRATALEEACLRKGAILLDLPPVSFEDGVAVMHGRHVVVVREQGAPGTGPLVIEIDGRQAGSITFEPAAEPAAAAEISRLVERTGLPVTLVSHLPEAEAQRLGQALGVQDVRGDLGVEGKAAFLREIRSKERPAFLGDCSANAEAAASAFVSICTSGVVGSDQGRADVVLMRPDLGLLTEALAIARLQEVDDRSARRFVLAPGVMCVAGALLFGVTSLAVTVVNNLGTLQLYRRASGSLNAERYGPGSRPGRHRPRVLVDRRKGVVA